MHIMLDSKHSFEHVPIPNHYKNTKNFRSIRSVLHKEWVPVPDAGMAARSSVGTVDLLHTLGHGGPLHGTRWQDLETESRLR